MTRGTLRLGNFGAEHHWRPDGHARLPGVFDRRADGWVSAMDEMLFVLARPEDTLVTRHPCHPRFREEVALAGFEFGHLALPEHLAGETTVERAVLRDRGTSQAVEGHERLEPFAVLPDTADLAERLGPGPAGALPDPACVARVNGKTWSNQLVGEHGWPGAATVVHTGAELGKAVEDVLRDTAAALIKDPHGVSGQGTLEITSPGMLTPLLRRLRRQEDAGRTVELLVQPRWDRRWDFSGHLDVAPDGSWRITGHQLMRNRGYRHAGSEPLPPELASDLERRGYDGVLEEVALRLVDEGYTGPACVDSMVLADGTWVPVLEVNARQSMGLLNLELDRRAAQHGLRSHLWQEDISVPPGRDVGDLLTAFAQDGLGYRGTSAPGVVQLAARCVTAPRGRLCCAVLCPAGRFGEWAERVRASLARVGIVVAGNAGAS